MAAKTDPINTSNPAGSSDPKQGDDYIRALARAVLELLAVDHYIGVANPWGSDASGDETGEHKKVTFHAAISDPTVASGDAVLYIKGDPPELYLRGEADGDVIQLTSGGEILFGSLSSIAKNTYLKAIDNAGTGTIDLIKGNASDKPVIKAGAELSTSGDPTAAAGIACKEWVEGQVAAEAAARAFGVPTTKDSGNDDMVKDEVYKAAQDGFVTAYSDGNNSETPLLGFIGSTSSPTLKVGANIAASTPKKISIMFPVKKDWYFTVTASSLSIIEQNIYWHPIGPYSGPVKQ